MAITLTLCPAGAAAAAAAGAVCGRDDGADRKSPVGPAAMMAVKQDAGCDSVRAYPPTC